MINLFENYNQDSWDLHYSLILSGYQNTTIAINDNGFLPDDVTSPFLFFTGFVNATGKPLHFNEIPVPKFWEIKATNSSGEIFDLNKKRATIHFSKPTHHRFVQSVDWLDESGKVRSTDHYNKYGYRFAQTIYDRSTQAIQKSYYDKSGKEVLVENYVTGDLILDHEGKIYIFKSKADFVTYYIQASGYDLDRIIFNSLGMPFLVKYQLHQEGNDILFWQEPIGDSLPYNMQLLLDPEAERKTKIIVQDFNTYEKILRMVTPEQREAFTYVGLLYPFQKDNQARKEALILTNSDQLDYVENIIEDFPDMTLHIAAITEMSSKLLSLGRFSNVHLYPNVTNMTVRQLFGRSDIYLDINQGNEILSAIRTAFESRQLILGFKERMHNPRYSAPEFFFDLGNYASFRDKLRNVLGNRAAITLDLQAQYKAANLAMPEDYRRELGQASIPSVADFEEDFVAQENVAQAVTPETDQILDVEGGNAESGQVVVAEGATLETNQAPITQAEPLEPDQAPVADETNFEPDSAPLAEAGARDADQMPANQGPVVQEEPTVSAPEAGDQPVQVPLTKEVTDQEEEDTEIAPNPAGQSILSRVDNPLEDDEALYTIDLSTQVSLGDTDTNDSLEGAPEPVELEDLDPAHDQSHPSVDLEPKEVERETSLDEQ